MLEGSDHTVIELADGLLLRRVTRPGLDASAAITRQAQLLEIIAAACPVPVPQVVSLDAAKGEMVLRKLPGTSLLDAPCPDPMRLADQLAAILSAIHGLSADRVSGLVDIDDEPLESYREEVRANLPAIEHALTPTQRRLVETFVASRVPPTAARLTFAHNDLGQEHLLASADRLTITGVIDWSDAVITDPARDLARVYRDLGPDVARRVGALLDPPAGEDVRARAAFLARCLLVEDLAYGINTGDHRYARAALANFDRTLAGR